MRSSAKFPVWRQTLIVLAFLALLGLFFALNLFIIIPQQQQTFNAKIFRLLQEATEDFRKRVEGRADYFAKKDTYPLQPQVAQDVATNGDSVTREKLLASFYSLDTTLDQSKKYLRKYTLETDTIYLSLANQDTTGQFAAAKKNTSGNAKNLPGATQHRDTIMINEVLEPTFRNLHRNLFDLVVLAQRDTASVQEDGKTVRQIRDKVLHEFGSLSASYVLPGDSLFREPRFGQFNSIGNIDIADTKYQAFTLPFRFANEELMLVGFIKDKAVKLSTTRYSKKTLLLIAFLLTIFILSLPLVKIYLSSRQEKIRVLDLRLLMAAFIVLPLIIVLVAITLVTYRQMNAKTARNLYALHKEVEKSFLSEITLAINQLKDYNRVLDKPDSLQAVYKRNLRFLRPTQTGNHDFKHILLYPRIYPNTNDIYWINDSGMQVAKLFFNKDDRITYFDVSGRSYFKKMKSRQYYYLGQDTFYIEPTISWSTGKYSVLVLIPTRQSFRSAAKKGSFTLATMTGLGSDMYSVYNPVMPRGYNFSIVNESGDILYHSETGRSLHENLFSESNGSFDLRNTIRKKDSAFLPDVEAFDRPIKMFVKPLDSLPGLYLVSYFNEREQNLFVFHVSAFTLLCTSITLFCLLLFMLLDYFFGSSIKPAVYTYASAWFKPFRKKTVLYQKNILFQICLVLLLTGLFLLVLACGEKEEWFLLQASILLPFFVYTGYLLLRNEFNNGQDEHTANTNKNLAQKSKPNNRKEPKHNTKKNLPVRKGLLNKFPYLQRNWRELLLYIFAVLFVWVSLNALHNNLSQMAALTAVVPCIAVPVLAYYIGQLRNVPLFKQGKDSHYLTYHTSLICFSLFFVSVLPAFSVYSFALKEEKSMWVKANQFQVAKKIEARRDSLNSYFADTKVGYKDTDYIEKRKLAKDNGLYLLHDTAMFTDFTKKDFVKDKLVEHSPFYQAITGFLFLPRDHADFYDNNEAYYWHEDGMARAYATPANEQYNDSTGDSLNETMPKHDIVLAYKNETDNQTLKSIAIGHDKEDSRFFAGFFTSYANWLVVAAVVFFFILHALLLRNITRKVFLLDYFNYDEVKGTDQGQVNEAYAKLPQSTKEFFGAGNGALTNDNITKMEDECIRTIIRKNKGLEEEENKFATENANMVVREEQILHIQYLLTPAYNQIWSKLNPNEQYLLYDFALDGFTNYKNMDIIYGLYQRSFFRKTTDSQLNLMSHSFRSYLLGKSGSKEIYELEKRLYVGSTWKNLRNIFFILILAVLIFLLATQQDVSNRILLIVSGLATLVPGLLRIFDQNISGGGGQGAAKK